MIPNVSFPFTPAERAYGQTLLDLLRDAQYLYELDHRDDAKTICEDLLKDTRCSSFLIIRVCMLLFNIADDWDEREGRRLLAETYYKQLRAIYPEGSFADVDKLLASTEEDLERMVDNQAENNPKMPPASDSIGSRVKSKSMWRHKEEAEGAKGAEGAEEAEEADETKVGKAGPSAPPLTGGWMKASAIPLDPNWKPYDAKVEREKDRLQDEQNTAAFARRKRIMEETDKRLHDRGLLKPGETLLDRV